MKVKPLCAPLLMAFFVALVALALQEQVPGSKLGKPPDICFQKKLARDNLNERGDCCLNARLERATYY